MEKEQEIFWRKTLDTLKGPFPEVGLAPPVEEIEKVEPPKELINGIDPESLGSFSKVTVDLYMFLEQDTRKCYMMQSQIMTDYGEVQLKKAIEIVKRKQRRNKG